MRRLKYSVALLVAAAAVIGAITSVVHARGGGPRPRPVIYVTSQELYYDSIVTADPLPPKGRFQILETGAPGGGLQTEYGPGQQGYVGGRWKMYDPDHPNAEDDGYHYFSCPLLGPGRPVK